MSAPLYDYLEGDIEGYKTLFVVPSIPDGASQSLREGLVRRRLSMITGECPCGGRRARLSRAQRRGAQRGDGFDAGRVQVRHADECLAISPEVELYMTTGWRWGS